MSRKKMTINPAVAEEAPMSTTPKTAEMTDAEAIETLVRTDETHLHDDDPHDDQGNRLTPAETPMQVPVAGDTVEGQTVKRTQGAVGMFHVLSEIDDGVFVAWDRCHNGTSRHSIADCNCKGGPVEPPYVTKWRLEYIAKRNKETKKAIDALKKDARQEVGLEPLAATVSDGIDAAKEAVQAAATEEVPNSDES